MTNSYRMNPSVLEVLWTALPGAPTTFPCVDCGLMTGNFCDGDPYDQCLASNRVPRDFPIVEGYQGLHTPLCSYCETCFLFCRFCRGVAGCTPPARRTHWSGVPRADSRGFDVDQAELATSKEFATRNPDRVPQEECELVAVVNKDEVMEPK